MVAEPIDALEAGVIAVARIFDEAVFELDAEFIAELRASHGTPEWERPAPMHIQPYDI